ncbi:MAG: hypothetical protein ABEI99_01170, partial [Halobaculum sp.]
MTRDTDRERTGAQSDTEHTGDSVGPQEGGGGKPGGPPDSDTSNSRVRTRDRRQGTEESTEAGETAADEREECPECGGPLVNDSARAETVCA